jgi:hypothetical protein
MGKCAFRIPSDCFSNGMAPVTITNGRASTVPPIAGGPGSPISGGSGFSFSTSASPGVPVAGVKPGRPLDGVAALGRPRLGWPGGATAWPPRDVGADESRGTAGAEASRGRIVGADASAFWRPRQGMGTGRPTPRGATRTSGPFPPNSMAPSMPIAWRFSTGKSVGWGWMDRRTGCQSASCNDRRIEFLTLDRRTPRAW